MEIDRTLTLPGVRVRVCVCVCVLTSITYSSSSSMEYENEPDVVDLRSCALLPAISPLGSSVEEIIINQLQTFMATPI